MNKDNFNMSSMYRKLQNYGQKMEWRGLLYGNTVRPKLASFFGSPVIVSWPQKDRLVKFRLLDNMNCCFCAEQETMNHIFSECNT